MRDLRNILLGSQSGYEKRLESFPTKSHSKKKILRHSGKKNSQIVKSKFKLEHGKWYIAKNEDLHVYIDRLHKSQGSTLTRVHKPIKIEKIIEDEDVKEITLAYMRKYG